MGAAAVDDGDRACRRSAAVEITERRDIGDNGVSVGSYCQSADSLGALDGSRIECLELFGKGGATHRVTALKAGHRRIGAVQIDHIVAAGLGVQQVDVLGDGAGHMSLRCSAASARCPALGTVSSMCRTPA